jgi:hypothetical protein
LLAFCSLRSAFWSSSLWLDMRLTVESASSASCAAFALSTCRVGGVAMVHQQAVYTFAAETWKQPELVLGPNALSCWQQLAVEASVWRSWQQHNVSSG